MTLSWISRRMNICRSKPVDYNSIASVERHFLAKLPGESSAIAEGGQVFRTINALNIECEARLNLFKKAGVKNILDYNKRFIQRILNPVDGHRYLPDIIILLDDLSTFLDNDTSTALIRLTQQNLYTGIYLIAVTSQITSRNISLQLRANFSVRLSMKLMSQNESRKILDRVGAEKLVQPGELLYQVGDTLRKGTQPFIEYKDIIKIVEFIGGQRGYPSAMLLPEYIDADSSPISDFDINDCDSMFEDAARLIVLHQQGSTTLIQRKLKLGYNRAGRIIDQLEAAGIVGPFEGSKAREVLFPDEYSLELFLDGLKGDGGANKVTHQAKLEKPAIVKDNLPKRHSIKGSSFGTDKPELTIAAKTPKTNAPSKPDKSRTNMIVWVIILFIALLIYFVSGWEGLVRWFR